jgi:outer membrane protein
MKLRSKIYFIVIICCATLGNAYAQQAPLLTLQDAVDLALNNNFNIRLSKNNTVIAKNNVTLGNAGALPSISADASTSNSLQNTNQTRFDSSGRQYVKTLNNVHNATTNYGLNLNWTIFNGFAMFANYDQLKKLDQLSEVQQRDTVESVVASVISTYYNLVNQNQQIKALQGAIEISRTQLRFANDKFQVGRGSGLDVLNARVNVNTDTATLISQIQQYKTTKVRLNQLMVRDLQTDFTVVDTLMIDTTLKLGDIITQAQTQNPSILISQINRQLADINLRQVKAQRYPVIGLNTGYGLTYSKTPSSPVTPNQNNKGLNYGLSASINIFNGFNQNRLERNARIQIDNAQINLARTRQNIEAQINDFYINYLSGLDLVKLEKSNVDIAKRNLDISLEKYKLGNITPLEIREAQRNYLQAESVYFQSQYATKSAEVTLKEITNSINIQ